jgi:hypothetical protein
MYVDQDDTLEPEALERMYAFGHANAADVVLGKVISDFRAVDHKVYREQRARCSVFDARLMYSLTPHKMLGTQFLRDAGIRYPEGRRRLEDQLFMTKAYFAAKNVAIVSDYVCYRYLRRPDGGNAGGQRLDPPGYYANLEEVLDVVDAYTEPGELRDHFYRRFLRNELLGRLTRRNLLQLPEEYGESLLSTIRQLLATAFRSVLTRGFPPHFVSGPLAGEGARSTRSPLRPMFLTRSRLQVSSPPRVRDADNGPSDRRHQHTRGRCRYWSPREP